MPRFLLLLLLLLASGCNSKPPAATTNPLPPKAIVPSPAPAKEVAVLDIDPAQAFVTSRTTDPDPFAARAHLPLPIRISGLSFLADRPQERGWIPGIMADGRYLLKMESSAARWYHADLVHQYLLAWNDDGSFIAQPAKADGAKQVLGKVDLDQGRLIWDGEAYSPVSSEQGRSSDMLLADDWRMERSSPSSVHVENRVIDIDLTSSQRSVGMFAYGLGSVTVHTFGHHDGYCVFAVTREHELGERRTLHRLPVTDCWARVELGSNFSVAMSNDGGHSKPIFSGRTGSNRFPLSRLIRWGSGKIDPQGPFSISFQELLATEGREPFPGDRVRARIWFYDAVEQESMLHDRALALLGDTLQGAE